MNSEAEEPVIYSIRLTLRARRDISIARERFVALTDEDIADAWETGIEEAISHLATSPIRPLIAEQNHFRIPIRQLLYRRLGSNRSSPAYRVIYHVDTHSPDGPTVTIMAVRHASMAPITAEEAQIIEGRE